MAVEVIPVKKTVICRGCHSMLRYDTTDVGEIKVNRDYLGEGDVVRGIVCPSCKTPVQVD